MSASAEKRNCRNCETAFAIAPDDISFYEKIGVPPPTFCPQCRLQRRMLFRNERDFYKRKCDLCDKSIVAVYPPDFKTPVYCVKCWWSDNWDAKKYGRDYDPSRSFMEQFRELFYEVPMLAMQNDDGIGSLNCEYTYDLAFCKNCYLVMCNWETENAMYSVHVCQSKDMVDCYYSNHCNLSYELVNSYNCYGCNYCTLCVDSQNCTLSYDLRGCSDCILCVGLRNKRYCIMNQQYSKEEYEKEKEEMQLGSRAKFKEYKKQLEEMILRHPNRYAQIFKSPYSTGDVLYNCKASKNCFYFQELEDCRYMVVGDAGKASYDCNNTGRPNFCYESVTPDNSYACISTVYCWKCNQAEYSNNCHSSSNILGCSGIRHSEYMILNKQYSKEEFAVLREKIVEQMKKDKEWGEFFPASMSPHAYNETPAQDWVPLSQTEAEAKGFHWKPKQEKSHSISMSTDSTPDTIEATDDSILNETIACLHAGQCEEKCTVAFKLIPEEIQFYKKMNIPPPELCHNCRYYERLKRRNLPKLYKRSCQCAGAKSTHGVYENTSASHKSHVRDSACPNEFETPYDPDGREIIYCEECYQAEIL